MPIDDFAFTTEKMSNSGALFDFLKAWAEEFKQELLHIFEDHAYLEKTSTSDATRSATRGKTTSMRSISSVKSARAQDCQNFYKLFCPQEGAANRIKSSLTKAVPHYGTAFLHCRTPPLYIFSILTMIKIKNNESRSKGLSWKNNIMRRI